MYPKLSFIIPKYLNFITLDALIGDNSLRIGCFYRKYLLFVTITTSPILGSKEMFQKLTKLPLLVAIHVSKIAKTKFRIAADDTRWVDLNKKMVYSITKKDSVHIAIEVLFWIEYDNRV